MTAATVPGVDLDTLLDQDSERACEIFDEDGLTRCGNIADWVLSADCLDRCESGPEFMCEPCRQVLVSEGFECVHCQADAVVAWIEPLR
jgi:hypothetical protein